MSTGSWDDSANLVPDSPLTKDSENVFVKKPPARPPPPSRPPPPKFVSTVQHPTDSSDVKDSNESAAKSDSAQDSNEDTVKTDLLKSPSEHLPKGSHLKKPKGTKKLGFLHKRAKSPSKFHSKSPSKSPSQEILTHELSSEDSVDESVKQKSEHWQAFMQMQDRIKSNVLKTQTTLGKLSSGHISPTGQTSPEAKDSKASSWTRFDDDESQSLTVEEEKEHPEEHNFLDLMTCDDNGNEDSELSTLIILPKDLPHLKVTPDASPSQTPKPPVNSRRSSGGMEHEPFADILDFEKPLPTEIQKTSTPAEVDLLGLCSDPPVPNAEQSHSSVIVNEDLLGLGDLLSNSASPVQTQPAQDPNEWFFGSYQSSAQSSLCASPLSFDDTIPNQDQLVPDSTAVSDLAKSLVDDFLQWGVNQVSEEQQHQFLLKSKNPFHSDMMPSLDSDMENKNVSLDPFGSEAKDDQLDGIWGSMSGKNKTSDTSQKEQISKTDTNLSDPFGSNQADPFSTQPGDIFSTKHTDAFNSEQTDLLGGKQTDLLGGKQTDPFDNQQLDPFESKQADGFVSKQTDPFGSQPMSVTEHPNTNVNELDPFASQPNTNVNHVQENIADNKMDIFGTAVEMDPFASQSSTKMDQVDPFTSQSSAKMDQVDPFTSQSSAKMDQVDLFASQPSTKIDNMDPFASQPSTKMDQMDPFASQTSTKMDQMDPFASQTSTKMDQMDPFASQTSTKMDQMDLFESHAKPASEQTAANDVTFDKLAGTSAFEDMSAFGDKADVNVTAASGINPFMDSDSKQSEVNFTPMNDKSNFQQNMDFEDDGFFAKCAPVASADASSVWGTNTPGTASAANPFQDDAFTADTVVVASAQGGETDQLDAKPTNPFLTASFENIAAASQKPNPFLDDSTFGEASAAFGESIVPTSTGDTNLFGAETAHEETKMECGKTFDPFATIVDGEHPEDQLAKSLGPVSQDPNLNNSTYDNLNQTEEDKETEGFMLEIKSADTATSISGPVPALPPPPAKPTKSPQLPQRENPFDRDSPPEENFAKFQVIEEEIKNKEPREVLKSMSSETSTPEEPESLEPIEEFYPNYEGTGWRLMLRQPTKKKLAGNRFWKTVFVKLVKQNDGPVLKLYNDEKDNDAFQELPLQPCYSISDMALQQFDQYGKIHTVKIQYLFYRERVGIRSERITPSFVRKPKPTMILDHAPQVSELLKFGSLNEDNLRTFVYEVEDAFMKLEARREKTLTYTKDECQAEVWDEYFATVDKEGHVLTQKARVRVFFLAFVTGMPICELGMNDKRRKGREVVGRHDIIPVKTEDWIKIENPEFHCSVDLDEYAKTNTLKFQPLDACQFELLRFRVRPKVNRELPMQMRIQQILKDRHFEIRCDMLVTGYHANSKKHGQFPCEDIEIRFPVPDTWIYLFRYEKRFGYGSYKSQARKPGKIKGLERLTMMAQGVMTPTLMEASTGTAKYENLFKAVVWRISRLPERNQGVLSLLIL